MGSSPRQVPHKPRRETSEVRAKELNTFRRENQKLRREVSRLRRELEKLTSTFAPDVKADEPPEVEVKSKGPSCLSCGSTDLAQVRMGTKTITACKTCQHRSVA